MKYDFLCELCEQEHHILSVRFLFFFIAVSEINLWKPLKIVYNRQDRALNKGIKIHDFKEENSK